MFLFCIFLFFVVVCDGFLLCEGREHSTTMGLELDLQLQGSAEVIASPR